MLNTVYAPYFRLKPPSWFAWFAGVCKLAAAKVAVAVFLLALVSVPAHAQVGQLVLGNSDRYALSESFTALEDKTGQLKLEDILQLAAQSRFRPAAKGTSATNFGLTRSAFWLRITLTASAAGQPAAAAPWLLEVAYPPLDHIELYVSRPQGGFDKQTGGDLQPFSNRAVPHRNHVFPISLLAGQPTTVYMRVMSEGTLAVPRTTI